MPGQKASEDERRKQILRAAFDVASRRGLASLTVRLVAAKAGLSTGLVLFHFESKEVADHGAPRLCPRDDGGPPHY